MLNFDIYLPTKLVFGPGRFQRLGKEAAAIGRKALLVTGKSSMRRLGYIDKAEKLLTDAGVEVVVFDKIEPNPRATTIDAGAALARESGCDHLIALGGGSPMDAAKGIAVAAAHGEGVWGFTVGEKGGKPKPVETALPLMTVPTMAATGSEANGGAVITNWETHEKAVLWSPLLFPRTSIIDPELTVSVPKNYTADGGVDIACHVLESYFTGVENCPLQDRFSEGVVRTVIENLDKALADPADIGARSNLSWCSTVALCGFVNSGRGGGFPVHVIEHALSGYYDISHGRGLGLLLPAVMEYTFEVRPEKYAQLGREVFDIRGEMLSIEERAANCIKAMRDWLESIGMPASLSQLGIGDENFEKMADDCIRIYGGGKDYLENPKKLYRDDIVRILNMIR